MTNTWGGQAAASTIMASFSLASNGTAGITYDNSVDGGNNGGSPILLPILTPWEAPRIGFSLST